MLFNTILNIALYPVKQLMIASVRKEVYPKLVDTRKKLNAARLAFAVAKTQESPLRTVDGRKLYAKRMENFSADRNACADACNDLAKLLREVKADIVLFTPKEQQQEARLSAQLTA